MELVKSYFGKTNKGETVYEYTIENSSGFKVTILNYGGIITEILAPDRNNKYENVVLGFDNIKDYEEKSPYFGSIVGRTAGRISGGKFTIDEKEYNLAKNNGNNNLHGGIRAFDKVIWNVEEIIKKDHISLVLSHESKHLEEGYPGNLKVRIIYTVDEENTLKVNYEATTDRKTIINLTNHSYFNLSGNLREDILNHKLTIKADKYVRVNEEIIPTGELVDLCKGAFDFREGKRVGNNIHDDNHDLKICGGYDHPFVFNQEEGYRALLEDEKSGRSLEIHTDQPVAVLYTGNLIDDTITLREGILGKKHLGLCIETQDYPDHINQPNFPSTFYTPENEYRAYTIYKFLKKM
ncbi:MAG: galactose mutarotase [Anaeromicrobium sp.]|jgi:aldose 1-epimerase|uniref:aldose epimerase family protein n=1 Tax=Anaeromicrobium sp. TaxID=1929132 RepID=UPI0025ECF8EF|nr:aldose epimerase family protein [Anaeromicrobium sp.]MCT4595893.1 galactose mutarotase [Anaeromicrobium sp.]